MGQISFKATVTLFSCKKAIGRRWGIFPENTHWLYRPILLYGIIVDGGWLSTGQRLETGLRGLNVWRLYVSVALLELHLLLL